MDDLLKNLPQCKKNASLKEFSGYKTGGKADWLFEPDSLERLTTGLKLFAENKIPYFLLGEGTNVLIHDEGFRGVVIRLVKPGFRYIKLLEDQIQCGPGVTTRDLSSFALSKGYAGFEFLAGFPGTLGGAVYGNAGDADRGICSMLERVQIVLKNGEIKNHMKSEFDFSYRSFPLVKEGIITELAFRIIPGETKEILSLMDEIRRRRRTKDPKGPSCGSVFRNPEGTKAWEIIDRLGLRGKTIGGAEIAEKHPNWIINRGNAKSDDIWKAILHIQKEAKERFHVELELELKLLGKFS